MGIYHPFIDSCTYESNIQHSLLDMHREIFVCYRRNNNKTLPRNVLASLEIQNISSTAIYNEAISDINFQLHQFHLEQLFIPQDKKRTANISVSLLQVRYICWGKMNIQHLV